ncbi:FecR family protein [uncultured Tenacibaculum sp.]|uniref:FecR family protein n=1 Tax=uncultured Tenacibaculum sp. TaxID=174713 RepID=UPI0026209B89|nr:FecR family protein [uncultured Tenacibaculum sp.]
MEKTDLIKKWLDYDLNPQELEEFKTHEDYDKLMKISEGLKKFKAKDVNQKEIYNSIVSKNKETKTTSNLFSIITKIAAIFVIALGSYFFLFNNETKTITSGFADRISTQLPDQSIVELNAVSSINFQKNNWNKKRELSLKGEAYFKVAKGSKFTVKTSLGNVSVLGTEFNVKVRDENFKVICYEGRVQVKHKNETVELTPGDIFKNGILLKENTKNLNPSWLNNESEFTSEPLSEVLKEFERQYNVNFTTNNINTRQLFTGKFNHKDLDLALNSITLPLNLNYTIRGNEIILKSEDPQ